MVRNIYHTLVVWPHPFGNVVHGTVSHHNLVTNIQIYTHFQHENFARGAVDVEFAVCRVVWIDTLASQEVDNVLWTILVAIGCRHLYVVYVVPSAGDGEKKEFIISMVRTSSSKRVHSERQMDMNCMH